MIEDRVEYFKSNDIFFGHNLCKIETMTIPELTQIDINDAIEYYEIKRYFDEGTRLKTWSDNEFDEYNEKSKKLYGLSVQFFNKIDNDSIVQQYSSIDSLYCSQFWALFDTCKLYEKISDAAFDQLIHVNHISPFNIFLYKKTVEKYGLVLRNYILDNECCISIILHVYEQEYTKKDRLYLPKELTGDDICSYLESYSESEHPNANDLDVIVHMQCTKDFPITDEIRLRAKRRYKAELEKLSGSGIHVEYGLSVTFSPDQAEVKLLIQNGNDRGISYSTKWLIDTLDYPSILNNFIYVFEYVDIPQMRCLHVSKVNDMGVFERITMRESSRVYPCGSAFHTINGLASIQMNAYYTFLYHNNIRLEDVLKWFFTEYLQREFNCPEIRVSFPNENLTYAEKCSTIITAFETVLRQFSLYVKYKAIDFELVGMSTTPIKFENIHSLVDKKNIYGTGKDFEHLTHLLFSDQCTFTYVQRIYEQKKEYKCFLDVILKEQIYISDYREAELLAFQYLADYDLISISSEGLISPKNVTKLALLKDLDENNVISKWYYPPDSYSAIKELIDKGILIEKNTLLSDPEINYLNYLLNRAEYCNGLEIRNKYIHGIQQVNTNEDQHKQNYYILLRIFVLLAIKINDDFCLNDTP